MMPWLDRALSKIMRVGKKDNNDAISNVALSASTYSSDVLDEDGEKLSKNQARKLTKRKGGHALDVQNEGQKKQIEQARKEQDERAAQQEPADIQQRYGDLPLLQSRDRKHEQRMQLGNVSADRLGEEVVFRARVLQCES